MRTTIWALGIVGIGVSVAAAQTPPGVKQRAATLLPPTAPTPADLPPIARGVADDLSPSLSTTPVASVRPGLWSNSSDPNVVPAGATSAAPAPSGVVVPTAPAADDQSSVSRGLDKLKGAFGSGASPEGKDQPNASSPYRGTTPNGSVVYAGPPAYRWYGWGSVTPGANPYAPTGQYPKASANWYSITGATPGAFPVPVSPGRTSPGTEPPSYNTAQNMAPAVRPTTPVAIPMQSMVAAPVQPTVAAPTRPLSAPTYTQDALRPNQPLDARPTAPVYAMTPALQQAPLPPATPTTAALPPPAMFAPPQTPAAPPSMFDLPPKTTPSPAAAAPGPEAALPPPAMLPPPALLPPSAALELMPTKSMTPPAQLGVVTPTQVQEIAVDPRTGRTLPALATAPSSQVPPQTQASQAPVAPSVPPQWGQETAAPATHAPAGTAPAALPPSVTDQQLKWQPTDESQLQGQWNSTIKSRPAAPSAPRTPTSTTAPPAAQPTPLPVQSPAPAPSLPLPNWDAPGAGAADTTRALPVARGQAGDNAPDPVASLIQRLCNGKAEGVDVRWTGSKRISVCFECPSAATAKQLVQDICARPEFVPYRIDFCVLVK